MGAIESIEDFSLECAESGQCRAMVVRMRAERLERQGLGVQHRMVESADTVICARDFDLPARRDAVVGLQSNGDAVSGADRNR